MRASQRALLIIQIYMVGIPMWWVLGADFIAPQCLAALLLFVNADAHRQFSLSDLMLAASIICLGVSAYVVGFLLSNSLMRFVAALYNLSLWVVGLVIVQQVRHQLELSEVRVHSLLRTGYWMFEAFVIVALSTVVFAYATHQFSLVLPSAFGIVFGHAVPDGAVIVRQATNLVFARPDWGLPGVPMPRLTIFGPYPTATGAIAAVGGTIALLYLQCVRRAPALTIYAYEGVIVLMLALTLTRSILAGWIAGWVIANLAFGTSFRRLAGGGVFLAVLLFASFVNLSDAVQYREYSSESRFANYIRAFNDTMAESPVLGLGIKPREDGNHIAIGSHSTLVSSFTKGGILGFLFITAYLFLLPMLRWVAFLSVGYRNERNRLNDRRGELRILLNLQIAIWVWLCFEDIDAPGTAATLIFMGFAFIDGATLRTVRRRSMQSWAGE